MENVSEAAAIFSSSDSWCRVIVGFLADCAGVELHHTCSFQALPTLLLQLSQVFGQVHVQLQSEEN